MGIKQIQSTSSKPGSLIIHPWEQENQEGMDVIINMIIQKILKI